MLNTPIYRRIVTVTVAASLALGPVAPIFAQKKFALTIENIMRGPGLYGYEPNNVRWSGDGSASADGPAAQQCPAGGSTAEPFVLLGEAHATCLLS